jgi:transposase InsO family protein
MVVVDKKDGGVRITSDLSSLNEFIVPVRHPLPLISDIFLQLRDAKFFSKIDIEKAYYSIALDEESKKLTATITPLGLMCYNRLPMGMKDSAAVFQKLVSKALSGCNNTAAYMDDILIYGTTKGEHDEALEKTLTALKQYRLKLNEKKCIYGVPKIEFLGYQLSDAGIEILPHRIEPLTLTPQPKTLKQLQAFLGAINYLAIFLPQLATIAEPLRQLTRKNEDFIWTHVQTSAFNNVKEAIATRLPLAIFDPNAETFVTVDASNVGLGAELAQIQHGKRVPIQFASHTLTSAEANYATNEKEALACLWACEHWEKFLLGRHFTLLTDHSCLLSLLKRHSSTRKSSKFDRWLDRLSRFDYTIKHIKGTLNLVADALSRLPLNEENKTSVSECIASTSVSLSTDTIAEYTALDKNLQKVIDYHQTQWPHRKNVTKELLPFFQIKAELFLQDNILKRADDRIVVPAELQKHVLQAAHQGHPGIVRMKRQLRLTYWWPGMDCAIEKHIFFCLPCQDSNKAHKQTHIPLIHLSKPTKAWSKIAIDIAGPFETAPQHQRFVTTAIDCYSNFPEVLLSNDITSAKLIAWLRTIFARFGNCDTVYTDNGPQFTSAEFTDFLKERDIKHECSAVYNPTQNSVVESFNRYIKYGAQTFQAAHKPFQEGITELLFNYRSTGLTPNGQSPSELLCNRRMRTNYQPATRTTKKVTNIDDTRECSPEKRSFHGPYKLHDMVRTRLPHVPKGRTPFSQPLRVTQVLGNFTYRLENGLVWNARKLVRYSAPQDDYIQLDTTQPIARQNLRRSTRANFGAPPTRFF